MKKQLALACLTATLIVNAQIGTRLPSAQIGGENSRWTVGGYAGLGGSFGNNWGGTTVYLMPRLGYMATENLETGIAGSLTWQNAKYASSTMVGIGPFVNYYFDRSFYLSGMYQHYFFNQKNKLTNAKYSNDEAALYLGAGYMQSIGGRAYMQIGGMYNLLYKRGQSIFGGAFVPNVGVVYGL